MTTDCPATGVPVTVMKPALVSADNTAAACSGLATALRRRPVRSAPSRAARRRWRRPAAPPGSVAPVGSVVAASERSSSARAGSLKSLVSWICAVTVAPARSSSDSTASRSVGSAAAVVISTTLVFGRVPRTASAPTAPAKFSSSVTRPVRSSFSVVSSSCWLVSDLVVALQAAEQRRGDLGRAEHDAQRERQEDRRERDDVIPHGDHQKSPLTQSTSSFHHCRTRSA